MLDLQCGSVKVGDMLVQISVCHNSEEYSGLGGRCTPSAVVWVLLAFLLLLLIFGVCLVLVCCCKC